MTTIAEETEERAQARRPRSRMETLGLASGALLMLYFAFQVFCFAQDDAFITYRYAWHLRHGFGPVFNPGERTEGYSCPLYMLLTALAMVLPGDVFFRAKLIGVACALATLWAAWRLGREVGLPPRVCAAIPLLLGANATVALSAIDGMETSLQALLVTLAAWMFVREQRSGTGWGSAWLLLAAALNRAEGALYFVAALLPWLQGIRTRGLQRRDALWLAAFLCPYALFLCWRHSYYGDWLPNPVYAKSPPLESALDYTMGPAYVLRTVFVRLNNRVVALLVSICLWLLAAFGAASPALRRCGGLLVSLGVLAQALVALRAGGDWMDGWRYMMAAVPLWTLLIAVGMDEVSGGARSASHRRTGTRLFVAMCSVVALVFVGAGGEYRSVERTPVSWGAMAWTTDTRTMLRQFHMSSIFVSVDHLHRLLPPGSTIAYTEMGALPFFTPELRWLDTYGLTDREVAHLEGTRHWRTGATQSYNDPGSSLSRLLLRRKPDYIVQWMRSGQPHDPILGGAYRPMARFSLNMGDEYAGADMGIWRYEYEPKLNTRGMLGGSAPQPH